MRGGWKDWLLMAVAAALLLLALILPFGAAMAKPMTDEELQLWDAYHTGEIIRLHVVAHSDTPEDQAVKMAVRDAVLERFGEMLETIGNAEYREAEALLMAKQEEIRTTSDDCLKRLGSAHTASVRVGRMHLPSKTYGQITLPAGEYFALRISIGSGEGQNWWCVLFPQLCLAVSETPQEGTVWHSKRIFERWTALPV